jgi:hypothetical protein
MGLRDNGKRDRADRNGMDIFAIKAKSRRFVK